MKKPEMKTTQVAMWSQVSPKLVQYAEPVRYGEWILNPSNLYNDATWVCSVCGEPWSLFYGTPQENDMHYCPNCGAKMEGGKDNGTAK